MRPRALLPRSSRRRSWTNATRKSSGPSSRMIAVRSHQPSRPQKTCVASTAQRSFALLARDVQPCARGCSPAACVGPTCQPLSLMIRCTFFRFTALFAFRRTTAVINRTPRVGLASIASRNQAADLRVDHRRRRHLLGLEVEARPRHAEPTAQPRDRCRAKCEQRPTRCRQKAVSSRPLDAFMRAGERGRKGKSDDENAVHEKEDKDLRAKVGELVLELASHFFRASIQDSTSTARDRTHGRRPRASSRP